MSEFDVRASPGLVEVAGEIDIDVTDRLRAALRSAAGDGSDQILIDLTQVTFIDSSGINELLRVFNSGHPVTLRAPDERVRRVIELVGLDQIFVVEG